MVYVLFIITFPTNFFVVIQYIVNVKFVLVAALELLYITHWCQ